MTKAKDKSYSSSFKYNDENEYYQTKQAAAALHKPVQQYILEAVLKYNKEVLKG